VSIGRPWPEKPWTPVRFGRRRRGRRLGFLSVRERLREREGLRAAVEEK